MIDNNNDNNNNNVNNNNIFYMHFFKLSIGLKFYSIQYMAALFHMFIQSIKSYTFYCHVLKSTDV